MLHRNGLQVANVASVLAVDFLLCLAPRHVLIGCIDNDTVVAMLTHFPSHIVRLVLASEEVGTHSGDATKRHPGCVKEMPRLSFELNGAVSRLRIILRLFIDERPVSQFCVDLIHPMSDIFIELDARELFLWLKPFSHRCHLLAHLLLLINRVVFLLSGEGGEFQTFLWLNIVTIFNLGWLTKLSHLHHDKSPVGLESCH